MVAPGASPVWKRRTIDPFRTSKKFSPPAPSASWEIHPLGPVRRGRRERGRRARKGPIARPCPRVVQAAGPWRLRPKLDPSLRLGGSVCLALTSAAENGTNIGAALIVCFFLATVEAGIHSRHPEEPAGTHAEVTRGHMPRREPTPWRSNNEMIRKHATERLRYGVMARCDNIVVPESSWMAQKKLH